MAQARAKQNVEAENRELKDRVASLYGGIKQINEHKDKVIAELRQE